MRQTVEFNKLPNGDLEIALLPNRREDLDEAIEMSGRHGSVGGFVEVIGHQLQNGWCVIQPEQIGALTSALILSDDAEFDDRGDLVSIANVWWDQDYQVVDPLEDLAQDGKTTFQAASSNR